MSHLSKFDQTRTQPSAQITNFLEPNQQAILEEHMTIRKLKAGDYLYEEGDLADEMFYVYSGRIKVIKTTEDGKELILHLWQAGDLFGEFGGTAEMPFTLNAVAIEETRVGILKQKSLETIISQHGDIAIRVMRWMGLMHKSTESKFRDLLLFGKSGALASTLIRMSNSYGVESEDGIRINLQLTNTDLANLIGTTRESVNRLLSSYRDEGVLSYDHGYIIIHKLEYLKDILNCPDCPKDICRM